MKKILVVDDSITVQILITEYFSKRSTYKIITAEDGEVALNLVKNDPPDLIILDIILPRINGLAFLCDIRRMETTKNIPVILISGEMTDEYFIKEGLALGAAEFIEKPFEMQYLFEELTLYSLILNYDTTNLEH